MCKHILNAGVVILAECCDKWYECSECHDEVSDHALATSKQLKLLCKNCKKCFNRSLVMFNTKDKYCNYCNVPWVVPGITPESCIFAESKSILEDNLESLLDSAGLPTPAIEN